MVATSKGKQLRIAGLIRVSTEKQEEQGESLKTQHKQIPRAAEQIGGRIVAWYGGQEHGTPGYEKAEVDRLIRDAAKDKFDAVMITHEWRWSRDNVKSEQGLEAFLEHDIRFFVLTNEYDLANPSSRFVLGQFVAIGKLNAGILAKASIENRIERAKRGIPTSGKMPFGRTFDKTKAKIADPKTCWSIIPDKHAMIKDIAKRYLATPGERLPALAEEYGMNHSNLAKILRERCGDTWTETFDDPMFKIHEVVTHKIPRLLPETTINAIHQQAKRNKTFTAGKRIHQYLLSGYIFCEHCQYSLGGQTNHPNTDYSRKSYYRHSNRKRERPCTMPKSWVDAAVIENEVVRKLFEMFGNPKAVERAIRAAIPNQEEFTELQQQNVRVSTALAKTKKSQQNLVDAIADGTISKEDAKAKMDRLREQEIEQKENLDTIADRLAHLPSSETIRTVSADVVARLQTALFPSRRETRKVGMVAYNVNGRKRLSARLAMELSELDHPENLDEAIRAMPWADKRELIESVFGGRCIDGKPAGVYVEWRSTDGHDPVWRCSIHGILVPERFNVRKNRGRTENAWH